MLPPACRLIANPMRWTVGTLARDIHDRACGTHKDSGAVRFDALGALFWAYKDVDEENRHAAAKRVFLICRARYGHTRLGQLSWDQAVALLKDAEA